MKTFLLVMGGGILMIFCLNFTGALKPIEAQSPTNFIQDVETHFDADGTGTFSPARACPCMIIKNEDVTPSNSVTVTQTFDVGGTSPPTGTFVLRGGESLTLGCTDRYPMFTKTVAWAPDANAPDVRVIAWEL